MPELPEVETTRLGIESHIIQQTIQQIIIRNKSLRWLIPTEIAQQLPRHSFQKVTRRGKYLLFYTKPGTMLLHLGMSGSLRILSCSTPVKKHDHVDIVFTNGLCLRYTDPRRFGCLLWTTQDPLRHPLLKNLGPEPLEREFSDKYLYQRSRNRNTAIKTFLMNGKIVVGVGNIYANEALFLAKINPKERVKNITLAQYKKLVQSVKQVLRAAIKSGGTTLRDFTASDGKPGYFKQALKVYDRAGLPCVRCKTKLKEIRLGQRSTFYCPSCQQL